MENIHVEVQQAARRAKSYWDTDGLPQIVLGASGVLVGSLFLWVSHMRSRQPQWLILVFVALLLGIYIGLLGQKKSPLIRWLKVRITYPRTGYVVPSSEGWVRYPGSWMTLIAAVSAFFNDARIGVVLVAAATTVLSFSTKCRFSFAHIYIPCFYLCAIFLAIVPTVPEYRIWYLFIAFNLLDVIAGAFHLVSYLRRHPVPQA